MLRIYTCVATEHDLRLIVVSVFLSLFGAVTSLAIVQRGLDASGSRRRWWLVIAGCVTGIAIWTTHFAAMLAYDPGVPVAFELVPAIVSVVLACAIAAAGWLSLGRLTEGAGGRAGGIVAIALIAAHFIDMSALRFGGQVIYDWDFIAGSLAAGVPLCVLAGRHLQNRPGVRIPIISALLLATGIVLLHFIAMSAVTILPGPAAETTGMHFGMNGLAAIVIGASATILAVALGVAYHDFRLAAVTAADRERLRQSEEHYRYSVELNPQIAWTTSPEGEVLEISPRWGTTVGLPADGALGQGWVDRVHPEDRARVVETWTSALTRNDTAGTDIRYRLQHADGSYRWYRARGRPRLDDKGEVVKWYGSLEDIHDQVTAEHALRASEERYRLASRATSDVIWDWSLEEDRVHWNEAAETLLGYAETRKETDGRWFWSRLHPDDRPQVQSQFQRLIAGEMDQWTQELRFLSASGQYLSLLSRGYLVREEGKAMRLIGSLLDITARKRNEDELRWAAHHDPLTQLPNRALFNARLDDALAQAAADGGWVGLMVIDVDRFKILNDTLGHLAGDTLLREVAVRLTRNVPPAATVARLGGDEFAVILPRLLPENAKSETIREILAGMDVPVTHDGRRIEISLSAGAAIAPRDGDNAEKLLKSADLALYAAKAEGTGRVRGFVPAMREAVEREKRMLSDARAALDEDRIAPFYQPKVCLRTGTILGFEALLRWHDHRRGIQPPGSIWAAFEDSQLAVQITDRMFERVCADIRTWLDQGCSIPRIAVNGSTEDFRRGDFADRILGTLARAGIPASLLELEVTETVFLGKRAAEVERTLCALCEAGVSIALDDFGTGYASLTHLKQFPVDTIKIDRSFVSRLTSAAEEDAMIVGALIDLAKNLRIDTVAEGVETALQADLLRRRGCDSAQGFLFSRAVPQARVPGLIASWNPAQAVESTARLRNTI